MRMYQSSGTSEKLTSLRSSNNFYNINICLVVIPWIEKKDEISALEIYNMN